MKPSVIIISTVFFALFGCSNDPDGPNVFLYVSNQSFAIDPVDISISIDSKEIIKDTFQVFNQHNWQFFEFEYPYGEHSITASSDIGGIERSEKFQLDNDLHIIIDFWFYPEDDHMGAGYTPESFSIEFEDEAPQFM